MQINSLQLLVSFKISKEEIFIYLINKPNIKGLKFVIKRILKEILNKTN